MTEHGSDPLGNLRPQPALRIRSWHRLGLADREQNPRPDQAHDRLGQERDRRGHQLDEEPTDRRPDDSEGRAAGCKLAVGLDERLALDDRGEEGTGRQTTDQANRARQERRRVQLRQLEHSEHVGDRDRRYDQRPGDSGRDQDRPSRQAIHPDAGHDPEEHVGHRHRGPEETGVRSRGVESQHRHERQRHGADLEPEHRDRIRQPVREESPVAPEVHRRPR
jgi:hypothetical protein